MRKFLALFIAASLLVLPSILPARPLSNGIHYNLTAGDTTAVLELPYSTVRDAYSDTTSLEVTVPDTQLQTSPKIHSFNNGPLVGLTLKNTADGIAVHVRFQDGTTHEITSDDPGTTRIRFRQKSKDPYSPPTAKLDFNFKNAPLRDVLRAIASKGNVNIVNGENVSGRVTLRLRDVPVEVALNAILKPRGMDYDYKNGIYYVLSQDQKDTRHEDKLAMEDGKLLIDVKNYPLQKLLKKISKITDYSIFFPSDLRGEVTLYLDKLRPQTAIKNILTSQNLLYNKEPNIFRIVTEGDKSDVRPHFDLTVDTNVVSLDVAKADLKKLINSFVQKADRNLLIFGEIRGQVNAKLEKVPIDDFIPMLLEGTQYTFRKKNSVFIVGKESVQGKPAKVLLSSEVHHLKHLKASKAKSLLPGYIPQNSVNVLEGQNALSITSSQSIIDRFNEFLNKVDKPSTVVMIKALVVDYSTDFSKNIGLSGTLKGGGSEITFEPGQISSTLKLGKLDQIDDELTANLQALIDEGKANVKARPKISTISGQSASIRVGTEEFFRVTTGNVETPLTQLEKIESGVKLKITPWVSDESDQILMDVTTEVSSPGQVNAEGLPAINTREAQAHLTIPDGETIVIGGLIQERETENQQSFPLLGDIPILGYLFSSVRDSTSKNELVFYITPKIVRNYENFERPEKFQDTAPITSSSDLKR